MNTDVKAMSEMAEQIQALVTKPQDLSSDPYDPHDRRSELTLTRHPLTAMPMLEPRQKGSYTHI